MHISGFYSGLSPTWSLDWTHTGCQCTSGVLLGTSFLFGIIQKKTNSCIFSPPLMGNTAQQKTAIRRFTSKECVPETSQGALCTCGPCSIRETLSICGAGGRSMYSTRLSSEKSLCFKRKAPRTVVLPRAPVVALPREQKVWLGSHPGQLQTLRKG